MVNELLRLFARWAALEPEVCWVGTGAFRDHYFLNPYPGHWISISVKNPDAFWLERNSAAILQRYLQERVNARGWGWSIGGQGSAYRVAVGGCSRICDDPAIGLLDCYLKVLSLKSLKLREGGYVSDSRRS